MHPFTPDLSDLDDEELLAKINDLYSKMRMVMNNPPVYQQMCALLDDYHTEQRLRVEKQKNKLDDSELSKKIDIGK
jgi:hypothetical protein